MAIIYSYPIVTPTSNDLVLGTDVDAQGKPTKNFTIQSIIDLVTVSGNDLQAVLDNGNTATQNIVLTGNISATNFTDGTITISGGDGAGFINFQSTNFAGDLTGVIKVGSSIAGATDGVEANNVTGVTQPVGTSNKTLATTAFVMSKVDPSILTFTGATGGDQTVNLVNQTFSLLGTTSEIKTVSSAQTLTISLADGAFGSGSELILPNGASATTQATTDDSTKVATTAFVRNYDDLQTLDFTDATTASTVLLNSQTLTFEGTANQVTTTVSAQKVKFSLPATVIRNLQGNVTGTILATSSIQGNAGAASTDAENVLAVTQTAGDNSTRIATTAYVDDAAGSKTLSYQADAAGAGTMPFTMNLSTDDLDVAGGSNISTSTLAVTAGADPKAVITVNLADSVTISGTSKADTFTTTAGTATWATTVLSGFTAITSDLFTGPLTGNADTATALASSGALTFGGEVTLSSSSPDPATYTSGGNITLNLGLNNAAVTGKILTGLVIPASGSSVVPSDTILSGIGKLQAQVNTGATGLRFMGSWNASMDTGGTDNTPDGTPALTSGGGLATSGTNTSVNTPVDNKLIDSSATFTSTVTASDRVYNEAGAFTTITSIDSDTELTLVDAIFLTTGQAYTIDNDPALSQGEYYVVSAVGASEARNATLNSIQNWQVGDWVIAGASNVWERLDQTSIEGAGNAGRIAKFSDTSVIADSIILEDSDGIKLDSGKTLTTQGTGGSLVVGGAATISGLTTAGAALSLTGGVTLPAGTYGTEGQVLTNDASPGATTDLIWTTPTTGTVTEVDSGTGLITSPATGIVTTGSIALRYQDENVDPATGDLNFIDSATTSTVPATSDFILFSDQEDDTVKTSVKKVLISNLPFNNYSWDLNVDGGTATTISDGNEVDFLSGTGIIQSLSTADLTTALRYSDVNNNPATGALNFIDATGAAVAPDEDDYLIFSNQGTTSVKNAVKRATIADIVDLGNENLTQVLANGNNSGGTNSINMTGAVSSILLPDSGTAAVPAADQGRIKLGGGSDLQIYHNGTHAFVSNTTGNLILRGGDNVTMGFSTGENAIIAAKDGATSIKYNNLDRVVTSSAGITVTGDQTLNGGKYIGYDGSGSQIQLSRDNTPTIAGHNLGVINFGGENFTSGSNVNTATLVAEAEGAWTATSNDTKLTMFLMNGTTSRWVLQAKSNRQVDFAGDVDIAGNLTVDGNTISGKGGTYIGDESFTDGAAAAKLFDIQRANSGALVFDLMLTVGSNSTRSIAKKFTVVHAYGATPIFVKTLDTGPDAGIDFDVTFVVSTNTGLQCKIAASGADLDVYYSIIAGHAPFSITIS